MKKYYLQVVRHTLSTGEEDEWVEVSGLEIHPDVAQQLVDLGIIEITKGRLPASQAARLEKLLRLCDNLGVNLSGADIILDLLERLEALQEELDRFRRGYY